MRSSGLAFEAFAILARFWGHLQGELHSAKGRAQDELKNTKRPTLTRSDYTRRTPMAHTTYPAHTTAVRDIRWGNKLFELIPDLRKNQENDWKSCSRLCWFWIMCYHSRLLIEVGNRPLVKHLHANMNVR